MKGSRESRGQVHNMCITIISVLSVLTRVAWLFAFSLKFVSVETNITWKFELIVIWVLSRKFKPNGLARSRIMHLYVSLLDRKQYRIK